MNHPKQRHGTQDDGRALVPHFGSFSIIPPKSLHGPLVDYIPAALIFLSLNDNLSVKA